MAEATRGYWITSGLGLLWNLIGVATYLMTVSMSADALADLPPAEQALLTGVPAWVTSAYAVAVFGGTLGCIALLLRRAWAVPLFAASFVGILIQMGHGFFFTNLIEVRGPAGAVLPLLIIGIAFYLLRYSRWAREAGLLV